MIWGCSDTGPKLKIRLEAATNYNYVVITTYNTIRLRYTYHRNLNTVSIRPTLRRIYK